MLVHQAILGQQTVVIVLEDVIRAANVLVSGLFLLYGFLWLTLMLLALVLSWNLTTGLCFWKWENWLLYPTLTLLMLLLIYFKNINVIRADIYLKEGERYRNQRQWSQAIALHEKALFLDSDEDFYYLMLALDYQLMAQDSNLDQTQRHEAWLHSERIALQARAINPYNPDNTGHLGRYYFTLGQIFNTSYYPKALDYFDRATQLAPANIIYHNLKAKTHYIMQEYETAIEALQTSISIDPQYAPTWILLGDTHAAVGQVDQALLTHQEGLKLKAGGDGVKIFANHFFDQRLKFYISANREDQLIAVLQQLAAEQKDDPFLPWAIGHTHNMAGRPNHALPYLKQAWLMDQRYYNGVELLQELTDVYISLNLLSEAIALNEEVVQLSDWDYTAWKNLAILYYRQSNPTRALTAAQQAQKLAPSDEAAMWLEFITQLQTKPY